MKISCSCGNVFDIIEEWILKDIKDFTNRKILTGKCRKCGRYHAFLSEERTCDGIVYTKQIEKKLVKKVLMREAKRIILRKYLDNYLDFKTWVYGVNKQIKNKKGNVTQIRQYASDFNNNKELVRQYYFG